MTATFQSPGNKGKKVHSFYRLAELKTFLKNHILKYQICFTVVAFLKWIWFPYQSTVDFTFKYSSIRPLEPCKDFPLTRSLCNRFHRLIIYCMTNLLFVLCPASFLGCPLLQHSILKGIGKEHNIKRI